MSFAAYAALAVAASGEAPVAPARLPQGVVLAQVRVQSTTVVKIPRANPSPQSLAKWKEKDAPKCIGRGNLAAAMVSGPTTIDLIVKGGTRYRVKLRKSCQAVDFYSGFYVKPTKDNRICEDRDAIHSRSGGACEIAKFKTLVPDK